MHRFILWAGSAGVAGLSVISLFLNLQFGYEIGGWLFAAASVCLDLVKMSLPVAFVIACMAKGHSIVLRVIAGTFFAAAWFLVTALSLQSAGGAALLNRTTGTGVRADIIQRRERLDAERTRLLKRNPWTPQIERYREQPSSAIGAEIEAYKNSWQWRASAECREPRGRTTRAYCQNLRMMEAAQQIAAGREQDAVRIRQIEAKLEGLPAIVESDPYSKAVADVISVDQKWVVYFWAALIAVLLEVVPNIGPALFTLAFRLSSDRDHGQEAKLAKDSGQERPGQTDCLATSAATRPDSVTIAAVTMATPPPRIEWTQCGGTVLDFNHYRLAKLAKQETCVAARPAASGQELVQTVAQRLGPGEHTLDKIMGEVRVAAAGTGREVPRKTKLGPLLVALGHERCGRRRQGNDRVTVYRLFPEAATTAGGEMAEAVCPGAS